MKRTALLLALSLALTACPPPPDTASTSSNAAPGRHSGVRPAPPPTHAPSGTSETAAAPTTGADVAPRGPEGKDTPQRIEYVRLGGGVYVPHCPECGEVQPENSVRCVGCGQELTPWGMETPCGPCTATGRCQRCGDDRACRSCDGLGKCPTCGGTGKNGETPCDDCHGGGECADCRGDGRREVAGRDFGAGETVQPGVCPTCVGGSGLCPECGSKSEDATGQPCLSCSGTGVCHDCGGTGACPHDGADGVCVVCAGSGREVRNGRPAALSERIWNVRLESGAVVSGVVPFKPESTVTVHSRDKDGREKRTAFLKSQLDPLSYFVIARAWAETGQDHVQLAQSAQSAGLWALALRELETAGRLDAKQSDTVAALLRDVGARRAEDWLDRADKLAKEGDRERALLLLQMVRFESAGTGTARQAKALELKIEQQLRTEVDSLDESARTRAAEVAKENDAAALARAERLLDRARGLLEAASRERMDDATLETTYVRADLAALTAQRVLLVQAHRDPPSLGHWVTPPDRLVATARTLRAGIVAAHAVRAVAAGRFVQGARLARRATLLDSGQKRAQQTLLEAERGRARKAVQLGSPPPRK